MIEIILFSGMMSQIFWLLTSFTNPGFIEKPKDIDFLNLLKIVDPSDLCPDCYIVKTPRSFHCSTCNICIERYDHHCPWLNNCVGLKNHNLFIIFLICFVFNLSSILGGCFIGLLDYDIN